MTRQNSREERFWTRVVRSPGGCWEWVGPLLPNGYGSFWPDGRAGGKRYAHAIAYEMFVGPIPDGMEIDHTCHNASEMCRMRPAGVPCPHRRCVNPEHLEAVTRSVNQLRQAGWACVAGEWVCPYGHIRSLTVKTTTRSGPVHYCSACAATRKRRKRQTTPAAS